MVATTISSAWKGWALSLALGSAIVGTGVGLAHAESQLSHKRPQIAIGLLRSASSDSFVCHANLGGWCDLRDWGPQKFEVR